MQTKTFGSLTGLQEKEIRAQGLSRQAGFEGLRF